VEGIRFCHFEDVDVVRHQLVQRIVRAYDSYGRAQQQLPLPIGDTVLTESSVSATTAAQPVAKPQ
jgi:phosphate starvation-inducible PhoH-like protein